MSEITEYIEDLGITKVDVSQKPDREAPYKTTWYSPQLHTGAFALPQFIREKLIGIPGFVQ